MDPDLKHDVVVDLLGAFALDAVDPVEVAAISAHLSVCPRCRDDVAQYQRAAAIVANTGGEAPAGVWDGIAARIDSPARPTSGFPPPPRRASDEPIVQRPRPRAARRAMAGAAGVAAAAIVLLGVEVGHLDHRLNQVTAASAGQTLTGAARNALLDPSAQRVTLARVGPGSSPAAQVVVQRSGAAFFFNQGLPALPRGQAYQLWAMIDGQVISVGVLGAHPTTVAFSVDFAAATKAFAVTVEPAGGSIAPTRAAVASATV
jgi:Anti-sigma-K factor rskA/Putative zinc-finger